MSTLTSEVLVAALARDLPAACAAACGGTATAAEAAPATGEGWAAAVALSGASTGRIVIWLDSRSAAACALRGTPGDPQPSDEAVAAVVSTLAARLATAISSVPTASELASGPPTVTRTPAPEWATPSAVTFDDGTTLSFRLGVELTPAATSAGTAEPQSDSRLEAVLEVDLPLVVRFGRAIMPLRAVAELSPGAVVDMGRTPDEPVELLVGERLVARGEVVIVGGN
jgi:flagellar motor switch protein FliN/FliY